MLRSRFLAVALMLFSIGVFTCSVLPANMVAEELTETFGGDCDEDPSASNVQELPGDITAHARTIAFLADNDAVCSVRQACRASALPQHVAEVPVPPPEA